MAKKATDKYQNAQSNEEHYLDTISNEIEDIEESMHKLTAEELSENPKKYYGKYVNYGIDLDGNSETSDWKLFYVGGADDTADVKGRIYLIAADYVPMNNNTLKDAMGEGTSRAMMIPVTSSEFKALSAFWGGGAVEPSYQEVTGLNPDPIKLFMHTGYSLNQNNANSKCVSALLNTGNWSGFAKGIYGEVAIGEPTLEMWCKAWNSVVEETDGFRKVYPNGNGTSESGYYIGASVEQTETINYYITSSSSAFNDTQKQTIASKYNVFFPHTDYAKVTANGTTGNCEGYWLASPSVSEVNRLVRVRFDGNVCHDSGAYTYRKRFASFGVFRKRS